MTSKCQNCDVAHGPDDMFCENCGYDFITGSLPADADDPSAPPAQAPSLLNTAGSGAPTPAPDLDASPPAPSSEGTPEASEATPDAAADPANVPDPPRITMIVAVDKGFFDAVVNDGEIEFPDPVPADQELQLAGPEIHIGRTSESRAIHPDIDVADLTKDQAASSRHAVIRVAADGSCSVTDVGSTNGTFLDDPTSDPIEHGVPIALEKGAALYVGAWTKLVIA